MEGQSRSWSNYILYALCSIFFGLLLLSNVRELFINSGLNWLYIFLFSLFVSYLTTPLLREFARSAKVLDHPNHRKVHTSPTPLLGGAAIYLGFAGSLFYNFVFSSELKGVGLGSTIILLAGLVDDVKEVQALWKFFVQIAAVTVMIAYGVVLSFMPETWWGKIIELALTYIWMLGLINAVNFFDGLDGLATGLGAISALYISLVAISTNQPYLMFVSTALLGSCLGFLPYNI